MLHPNRPPSRRRPALTLPIAIVAVVGWLYLRAVPTSTGDVELIAVLGIAGVVFGALAGALMSVRRSEDGSLVTVAGALRLQLVPESVGRGLATLRDGQTSSPRTRSIRHLAH